MQKKDKPQEEPQRWDPSQRWTGMQQVLCVQQNTLRGFEVMELMLLKLTFSFFIHLSGV